MSNLIYYSPSWTASQVSRIDQPALPWLESYCAIPGIRRDKHLQPQFNLSGILPGKSISNRLELNAEFSFTEYLILDYDQGILSIDRFIEELTGYEFTLYTTSNHTPESPRFRVILPLDQAISRTDLERFKRCIKTGILDAVDESSFEITRWHILPHDGPFFEYRIGAGKPYPVSNLHSDPLPVVEKQPVEGIKYPQKYIASVLPAIEAEIRGFDINRRGEGRGTNNEIFRFYATLYRMYKRCDYSAADCDKEAKRVLNGFASNQLTRQQIAAKKI